MKPANDLAVVMDELRRNKGWSVVLRGHDLRLRDAPRDIVKERAQPRLQISVNVGTPRSTPARATTCVPLRVRSYYTFLDSTLSPAAIVNCAKQHGLPAIALTDIGNLHGAVEFAQAAKRAGIKPIFGTELRVNDHPLLLYVESARGYHNLNRLLSQKAEAGAENEEGAVATQQRRPTATKTLEPFTEGLIAVSPDASLAELFPGRFYQMATKQPGANRFPVVACPAIHYALPGDRMKYDILQSIRTLTLLREQHPEKRMDGRFHFRTPMEMAEACKEHPEWLANSLEIADRCNFEIPFGKPQFPAFEPPDGSTPRAVSPPTRVRRTAAALPRARRFHASSSRTGVEHHHRRRLRRILSGGVEHPSGLPRARHRVDHPRQRGGFARVLLPRHLRCLPRSALASTSGAF